MTSNAERPIVLLVVEETRMPFTALGRATLLARKLAADLVVVVAIGSNDKRSRRAVLSRLRHRLDLLVVPHGLLVHAVHGSVSDLAIAFGCELDPVLVVTSPRDDVAGEVAVAISDALQKPVIVARERKSEGRVVVATDMTDLRYPVLSTCRTLVQRLRRPATYVHATPASVCFGGSRSYVKALWLADIVASTKLARLRALARQAGDNVEAVMIRSDAVLDGILEVASERNADLVAIGHPRRGAGDGVRRSISERVIANTRRSVLVIPFQRDGAASLDVGREQLRETDVELAAHHRVHAIELRRR